MLAAATGRQDNGDDLELGRQSLIVGFGATVHFRHLFIRTRHLLQLIPSGRLHPQKSGTGSATLLVVRS